MRVLYTIILLILPELVFATDPSASPVRDPLNEAKYGERYRVIADIDGDGVDDMLLSQPIRLFGKSHGFWDVYLVRNGKHVRAGHIYAHPLAISIESDKDWDYKDPKEPRINKMNNFGFLN